MKHLTFLFLITIFVSCTTDFGGQSADDTSAPSINGSYTTMLTVGNRLYAVSTEELTTYDITNRKSPEVIDRQSVGFQIESLYHYDQVLFIGSQSSLHIFSLDGSGVPERRSETPYAEFDGAQPCDPVVSNGEKAFVTLSSDVIERSECGLRSVLINELRVYDVTDLENPSLEVIMEMDQPKGLSLDGNLLFIALKKDGALILDVSNVHDIKTIKHFPGFDAFDLIARNGTLLVVGPKQIHTYDYNNVQDIKPLSVINL